MRLENQAEDRNVKRPEAAVSSAVVTPEPAETIVVTGSSIAGAAAVSAMADESLREAELDADAEKMAPVMPDPLAPEIWLQQLMHWKNLDETEKFEEELAKFRAVYPDYEIPPELAIE